MSVGKESIRRAANAGAKKNAGTAAKTAKATKTTKTTKTTEKVTRTTAKSDKTGSGKKTVQKSVISTQDAEKLEAVFVTGNKKEKTEGPVHIKEELPVYLL